MFYVWYVDWDQILVSGLSSSLFHILNNIPTEVGTAHRGDYCEFIIYAQLHIINMCIVTKYYFVRDGWFKVS